MTNGYRSNLATTRLVVATFGVFISAMFWLVIATYPSFFLFNPYAQGEGVRSVVLTLTGLGWLLIANGPVVLMGLYATGRTAAIKFLPVIALVWPVSLIINHISLFIQEGLWYTGYLADYPIFIVTDILLPLLLVVVWLELRQRAIHLNTKEPYSV